MQSFALRLCLAFTCLCISSAVWAGAWSSISGVNKIEVVRGQGLVIFGTFGNPNGCSAASGIWIKLEHPQYDQIYAMALTAMTAGMRLQAYLRDCEAIGWHGGTWNIVTGSDSVYLHPAG